MTTHDLTAQERALHDRLHAELVPPPMPDRLAYSIDRLAENEMDRAQRGFLARLANAGSSRWVRAAIAIVAIVAIAGSTLLLSSSLRQKVQVAATPIPSMPAITQPSLPPDAANPSGGDGRWFDANSAYLMGDDRGYGLPSIMETRDGGQTWQQSGRLPATGMLGTEMLDLDHGYAGDVTHIAGNIAEISSGLELVVSTTADGGFSWTRHVAGDVTSPPFGDYWAEVHFSDVRHGIVLTTTMSPYPADGVTQVWCPAYGTNGKGETCNIIPLVCAGFATDDGGATWQALDGVPCISLGGVHWYTPALGVSSNLDQSIATTTDGGRTWRGSALPGTVNGKSFIGGPSVLAWVDASTLRFAGVIAIDGETLQPMTVWESKDLGASWHVAYTAPAPIVSSPPDANGNVDTSQDFSDLWAFDADHWIAIFSAGPISSAMVETWDGGRTWSDRGGQQVATGMNTWHWADRLHGMIQGGYWVCADDSCHMQGYWLITNDGGQTWHQSPF